MTSKAILLVSLCISLAIATGGTPTPIQYPPETVMGIWGEDVVLQFAVNGTGPLDSIIIQGPDPLTGSNTLDDIFERGTGELNSSQPFEDNFTVSIDWSEGVTSIDLTIRDLQNKDVGKYRLSVTYFFNGADINVYGWSGDNITSSTVPTANSARNGTGSNNSVSDPGSTQRTGGLGAGYIVLIVFGTLALIAIIGVGIYKWWQSRGNQEASQQGEYAAVNSSARDNRFKLGAQTMELHDMSNHDKENGAPEVVTVPLTLPEGTDSAISLREGITMAA